MTIPPLEMSYVLQYGYLAVFVIMFVGEFAAFVPVGVLLIALGTLSHHHVFHFSFVFLTTLIASVLGNFLIFLTARRVGKTEVYRAQVEKNPLARRIEGHLRKNPWLTIFASRFIGIATPITNLLAGLSQTPRGTFLSAVTVGNALCILAYLTIGYLVGFAWDTDVHLGTVVGGILIALFVGAYIVYYLRSRNESTQS